MKKTLYTLLMCFSIAAFAQVPNPGFEQWDSLSFMNGTRIYDPVSWRSTNTEMVSIGEAQPIEISTDAHSGTYALKLTSMIDDGENQAGWIQSEKFAFTGRVKYFDFYYKYEPQDVDSFGVFLQFYKDGQKYGQPYYTSGQAQNQYTNVRWELTYPDNVAAPDSGEFKIYASIFKQSEGSVLLIDDISVGYKATGLNDQEINKPAVTVYPNPASKDLMLLGCPPDKIKHIIRSVNGAIVQEGTVTGGVLDVEALVPGLYLIQLSNENGWSQQLKFIRQ
jgi:hypothetical protein